MAAVIWVAALQSALTSTVRATLPDPVTVPVAIMSTEYLGLVATLTGTVVFRTPVPASMEKAAASVPEIKSFLLQLVDIRIRI